MTFSKKAAFNTESLELSNFSRLLSHPARIEIINHLIKDEKLNCGDFVKAMPLSQSTVSQHLKELRQSGLINGSNQGQKSQYSLNKEVVIENIDKMVQFLSNLTDNIT